MIICSCNRLSDDDVRRVARSGAEVLTPREVYDRLGCAARCGRCASTIRRINEEVSAV